jgi:hypothetical protein
MRLLSFQHDVNWYIIASDAEETTACIFRVTMKTLVADSSETLIAVYQIIWCFIPEDSNLHNHNHDNIKYHTIYFPDAGFHMTSDC